MFVEVDSSVFLHAAAHRHCTGTMLLFGWMEFLRFPFQGQQVKLRGHRHGKPLIILSGWAGKGYSNNPIYGVGEQAQY